jgi:hypothetical protein
LEEQAISNGSLTKWHFLLNRTARTIVPVSILALMPQSSQLVAHGPGVQKARGGIIWQLQMLM